MKAIVQRFKDFAEELKEPGITEDWIDNNFSGLMTNTKLVEAIKYKYSLKQLLALYSREIRGSQDYRDDRVYKEYGRYLDIIMLGYWAKKHGLDIINDLLELSNKDKILEDLECSPNIPEADREIFNDIIDKLYENKKSN